MEKFKDKVSNTACVEMVQTTQQPEVIIFLIYKQFKEFKSQTTRLTSHDRT